MVRRGRKVRGLEQFNANQWRCSGQFTVLVVDDKCHHMRASRLGTPLARDPIVRRVVVIAMGWSSAPRKGCVESIQHVDCVMFSVRLPTPVYN